MHTYVAERYLRGTGPDGASTDIAIRIGQPQEISEQTWTVAIDIEGLEYGMKTALGVDPWQALTVAFAVTEQAVRYFLEAGGKLCDREDEPNDVPVDDLFPRFAA